MTIVASGTLGKGLAPITTDWNGDYLISDIVPVKNEKVMKPSLFNADKSIEQYQKTTDLISKITGKMYNKRTEFLNSALLFSDNLFTLKEPHEILCRILTLMNGDAINEVLPYINEESVVAIRDNYLDLKQGPFVNILLNHPIENIDIPKLIRLSNVIDASDFFIGKTSKKHLFKPEGYLLSHLLDDFVNNIYALKTTDWINGSMFKECIHYKSGENGKEGELYTWTVENYEFIRGLLFSHFNPEHLYSFAKTKGFYFDSFVNLLFTIKDKIDLSYWNPDVDLWVNLNLMGYNPIKEINSQFTQIGIKHNTGMLGKLSNAQTLHLFVTATNTILQNFIGTNNFVGADNNLRPMMYSDFENAMHLKTFSKNQDKGMYYNAYTDYFDKVEGRKELFNNAVLRQREEAFNSNIIGGEYRLNFKDVARENIPALAAVGYMPAFTHRGKALNFSELYYGDGVNISKPHIFDMLCYLYTHRNWISTQCPVRVSRGRTLAIHPHTSIKKAIISLDTVDAPAFIFHKKPYDTFAQWLEAAAYDELKESDGPDFRELPDYIKAEMDDRFLFISNPFDLISEGRLMHHCCGSSHYVRDCADNDRAFFHFQPETEERYTAGVTFDVRMDIDDEDRIFDLSSYQLFENDDVPDKWSKEIKDFVKRCNVAHAKHWAKINDGASQLSKAC